MLTRGRVARALPPSASDVLSPLPRWFAHAVLLLLPVDTRLRCSGVDRAWRALLADMTLFSRLNLSASSGVARFSLPLFRAAVANAGGRLCALDVSERGEWPVPLQTLQDTLVANATTLKKLRMVSPDWWVAAIQVMDLLVAAPSLEHLDLNFTTADFEQCSRYLRNEPPYGPVRLRGLALSGRGLDSLARVEAFFADLHKQPLITHLEVHHASFTDAARMRVFVDAALNIETIVLVHCRCTPATVPELTRLVSGAVRNICINNGDVELFQAGTDTDAFCAAVRASEHLTRPTLYYVGPNPDAAAVAAFINARHA